jgi:hypothetical protein
LATAIPPKASEISAAKPSATLLHGVRLTTESSLMSTSSA